MRLNTDNESTRSKIYNETDEDKKLLREINELLEKNADVMK